MKVLVLITVLPLILAQLTLVSNDVLQIPINSQYQYSLNATGGQPPYTYSATGLPSGISIAGSSISGTASVAGVFPVVLTVQDSNKGSSNKHIFVYVTSPNTGSGNSSAQITTVTSTTTTTSNSSNVGGAGISSIIPTVGTVGSVGNPQQAIFTQPIPLNIQNTSVSSISTSSSGSTSRAPQPTLSINQGYISQNNQFGSTNSNGYDSSNNNPSDSYGSGTTSQSFNGYSPQSTQGGLTTINIQSANSPGSVYPTQYSSNSNYNYNSNNSPSNYPSSMPSNGVLIVPTTSPYITNYSFASTLQTAPTVSTQSTDSVFLRQANVNKAISSLLALIQNYNATLVGLQSNIPNTTSLLNDAIRNQRVAQAQVNSILAQNTTIANNISSVQNGIQALQNQILSTTNTLNNSQVQIQSLQSKITQDYVQINDTQNKLNQANNSLQDSIAKQNQAAAAINNSRSIILSCTQNITSIQNDISNAPVLLAKLGQTVNNQKSVILALQKQLQAAILALVPIQAQVDYYTMIPTFGPGMIQQNKTVLMAENTNLAQAQPVYDSAGNDINTYNNLISQLTSAMSSLQTQLSADKLTYNNVMGSQNNQQGQFNNTLTTIATQTSLLNRIKQQQQDLLSGPYNAALQVVSDTTSKVNQLTQTLNSLNQKYQSVQSDLTSTQKSLNQALQQKEAADQAVNQAIKNGGGSSSSSISSLSAGSGAGAAGNVSITITGNANS